MMRPLLIVLCALTLSGCNQYTLVKPGPVKVSRITVAPSKFWNATPPAERLGNQPTWTADGSTLNSITFFSAIRDGKPLFHASRQEQYPVFTADMLPTEIVELVESSLAKKLGATLSGRGGLKPLVIDGSPGFQFSLDFVAGDEVPRRAFIAGVVRDGALYLVLYQATSLYYYDKYLPDVMNMARGMRLN